MGGINDSFLSKGWVLILGIVISTLVFASPSFAKRERSAKKTETGETARNQNRPRLPSTPSPQVTENLSSAMRKRPF